jgi:polyhydroxybutyrate depolymerase
VIRSVALVALTLIATPALAESFSIGGTERTYTAIVPDNKPAPLVLVLHGNTQQGIDMQTRSSWPQLARREGIVAVFPDGLNRAWADLRIDSDRAPGASPVPPGTDDVVFLTALIARLVKDGLADPKRVYVTGVSNGGAMTMTLACRQPQLFAAAASVIATFTDAVAAACKPPQPIPMLVMNGTVDPLVNYQGGKGTSRHGLPNAWATERTVQFWKTVNGCGDGKGASTDLPDTSRTDKSTVTRIVHDCPPQRDVVLYRVNGGGHRMPGRNPDASNIRIADAVFGPQNHDIDGPDVIWEFFRTFSR